MRFIRDLVMGVIHLLAYIPRGIAHIPRELRLRRVLKRNAELYDRLKDT